MQKHDFLDPRNSEGFPQMADAAIALDLLMRTKNGVRNCAFAIAEVATPEVRELLRVQLVQGLAMHQEVTELMLQKGWLNTYGELNDQFRMDMASAENVIKIAELDLFPGDTSRIGLFATPAQ